MAKRALCMPRFQPNTSCGSQIYRHSLQSTCTPRFFTAQPGNRRTPDFAFAFDIDGVLLRSSTPIPGASESLSFLQRNHVPFILLTNGGGKTEQARVDDVSSKLSVPLSTSNFVQSHTPFAEFATQRGVPSYRDKCILVVGGDYGRCREVARSYGFTNVITPGDIFAAYPDIWPFSKNFQDSYYKSFAQTLPKPVNPESPEDSLKIDGVFVYNDPRDWGLDIQILLDVMLSREGIVGTYSSKNGNKNLPNNGYLQDGQPPLYYSNPDLLWANAYHLSRLGQGGFREALDGVWNAVTAGAELKKTVIGKPYRETYEFAEKLLLRHRATMLGRSGGDENMSDDDDDGMSDRSTASASASSSSGGSTRGDDSGKEELDDVGAGLKRVYMVGDNPESDIKGANSYQSAVGAKWISLLTRTGVYKDRADERPSEEPVAIVDDVREAVRWALKDSKWDYQDSELD